MPAALWSKTNFSFLEGASHPDELVATAHQLGLDALAITDRDGVHGIVRAHVKARELGMRLLIGSEINVRGAAPLLLLASDRHGYGQLTTLLTVGRRRAQKGDCLLEWRDVCEHADGLLALAPSAELPLDQLREAFDDRLYALVTRHHLPDDAEREGRLRRAASRLELPVVGSTLVLYHTVARRQLQDVLTCIRHGVTLHDAGRRLRPNAEHALLTPHVLAQRYADDPAALGRHAEIIERCQFNLDQIRYRYPAERLPDGVDASQHLTNLTFEGARKRYGGSVPAGVAAQLGRELALIAELDYGGYFLTMVEIVEFCRRSNILCQGRGSAANSAVCFCLGITAIDPVRMGLLFERFLSRERAEPPDIDLDIEHERREEVIQHVYARYGRSHAAMVANVISYRARSAIRDVGKALGLPATGLDRLTRLLGHHYDKLDPSHLEVVGLSPTGETSAAEHLFRLAEEIQGFPRHLSIHPGGFLLGHEPVSTLVPIENGTMADRTVIQWDKDDVEALGLFKVDLLGLGALTHLHRTFDLLREHQGLELSMATIPADDPATYDQICAGDTVGVFQIESRAQMAMLPRLKPRNYYDLVVEVSIVRPGPITGGMVHPYLRRRRGEEPVDYPHDCLRPVLERTLGVPLFQEQVMKLAIVAADYTPGEADQLRRDMAAWRKTGRIEQHRTRLVSRMQKKGIATEFAERVFEQIRGFGEYGFPESHAASFALVSYAGAWLRRHHQAAFTCGLLDAQPMGFYTPATIVDDARRHGVEVRPIDVRVSGWNCSLEPAAGGTFAVRMGLRYVRGLGEADGKRLEAAAPFASIEDLAERSGLNARHLEALATSGALRGLESARRQALWQVKGISGTEPVPMAAIDAEPLPALAPLDRLETISWDLAASSHSTSGHPLGPMRAALTRAGLPSAQQVSRVADGVRMRYAGLVICRQRPGTASGVTFMTLEDETGFVNVVLWKRVFETYGLLARTQGFLGIEGRIQAHEGVVHLVAESLFVPELRGRVPEPQSRDFR